MDFLKEIYEITSIGKERKIEEKKYKSELNNNVEGKYLDLLYTLNNLEYSDYLKTKHWKHFSKNAKIFYGNKCCECNSDKNINIHHLNYINKGRETFLDVQALCKKCHEKCHKIKELIRSD